jgi:predicted cytidylate kinase
MIITLSGKPGSGKSTVARLLAERLGYRYEDMGLKRRKLAEARGITLEELNIIGEKEDWTDREVDEYQKRLGEKEDNLVISGWTSFHFIPNSVKVFLEVSEEEGSRRIHTDSKAVRKTEAKQFLTLEDVQRSVRERMENSSRRYKKYYGIDIYDPKHYDLIVDTTSIPAEKVVERIADYLQKRTS